MSDAFLWISKGSGASPLVAVVTDAFKREIITPLCAMCKVMCFACDRLTNRTWHQHKKRVFSFYSHHLSSFIPVAL
jgi:hypothetical protein